MQKGPLKQEASFSQTGFDLSAKTFFFSFFFFLGENPHCGFRGKTWVGCWVEPEFSLCIESVLPKPVQPWRGSAAHLQQEWRKNAAVNLCQRWQRWRGCRLLCSEGHVFIMVCHLSAEKSICSQAFIPPRTQIRCDS